MEGNITVKYNNTIKMCPLQFLEEILMYRYGEGLKKVKKFW